MRSLSPVKLSSFALALASSLVLVVGCGGGKSEGAKAPEGATNATASATPTDNPGAGGTTTTSNLPDGGELQGAKLGSTTHSEVETKGGSGPKAGPGHAQEPGRSRQDIQTIILAHRDEARACYDKGLKDHPGIEGDLTVKWVIDPTGKVGDASVDSSKSTITEASVGDCIVVIIKKISFAPSKGGFETRANYPFNFHPKGVGKADAGAAK